MKLLYVGLAYSNIQNEYDAPSIIAGVRISGNGLKEIQRKELKLKDKIIPHVNSLRELRERFNETQTYLDDYVTITRQNVRGQVDVISDAYLEAVIYLLGDNFPLLDEELVISYRKIVGIPCFHSNDISATVKEKIQKFAARVEGRKDDAIDYPMQIARLLARMEYEQIRFTRRQFLMKAILRHPTRYFQFYKISYQRTYPEDYVDNFVSLPEFVIRKAGRSADRLVIKPESTFIDFQTVAKFCRGVRENGWIKPCESSSEEQPYGNLVYGSENERCDTCRKKETYVECLKRKPSCDGIEVSCKNKYFAGEICNGEFGLYITRYGDSLKVGKAFLPNLVSRLLDQGANSALLIYPVSNIERAYKVENALKMFLEERIEKIGQGITKITLFSPATKEKVYDFLEQWDRVDKPLLLHLTKILENGELRLSEEKLDFSAMEKRVNSFLANYKVPPLRKGIRIASVFERISGKIIGYRGGVIFLDSKVAVDMKKLQGYLLRGRIRCLER